MKPGANSFHLAGVGYFCKITADYFCYISGWPEDLHLDTISSSSDFLALFSKGSTAPCEQGSQGPFTPGAAKCQKKLFLFQNGLFYILLTRKQSCKDHFQY